MADLIPSFSLARQSRELAAATSAAAERVLASGRYAQGPECEAFEAEVAAALGGAPLRALTCASGTDALHLALRAVGVGPGDVVLTSPFTFFATAGAILLAGAHPEFVDIAADSFNLSPVALAESLVRRRSQRVAAILPVHLYGRVADMVAINALAQAIPVVEDAAQAIGASLQGRAAGSWGAAGCFSFYPTKNLGAMGEGGLVTTSDAALDARLRLLRVHGSRRRYEHETLGWNARMHEIQAAILRAKLPRLALWNQRRRAIAAAYEEQLNSLSALTLPERVEGHVFHQYVIRIAAGRRDALRQFLLERQIGTEVYYPIPLHQQPALRQFAPAAPLPEAERAAREVVALPMFPELTDDEVTRVCAALTAFANH